MSTSFVTQGYLIAISNINAVVSFYSESPQIIKTISKTSLSADNISINPAEHFNNSTLKVVLRRCHDPNILSFVYVTLLFIYGGILSNNLARYLLESKTYPWKELATLLFPLVDWRKDVKFLSSEYSPLPEDYAVRGLLWSQNIYPKDFWNKEMFEGGRYSGYEGNMLQRKERISWLTLYIMLAPSCFYISTSHYSESSQAK